MSNGYNEDIIREWLIQDIERKALYREHSKARLILPANPRVILNVFEGRYDMIQGSFSEARSTLLEKYC